MTGNKDPRVTEQVSLTKGVHCEFCAILRPRYLLTFTAFEQYQKHIIRNHSGYPINPTKEELKRFRHQHMKRN